MSLLPIPLPYFKIEKNSNPNLNPINSIFFLSKSRWDRWVSADIGYTLMLPCLVQDGSLASQSKPIIIIFYFFGTTYIYSYFLKYISNIMVIFTYVFLLYRHILLINYYVTMILFFINIWIQIILFIKLQI
jgi:hypothetical protein